MIILYICKLSFLPQQICVGTSPQEIPTQTLLNLFCFSKWVPTCDCSTDSQVGDPPPLHLVVARFYSTLANR